MASHAGEVNEGQVIIERIDAMVTTTGAPVKIRDSRRVEKIAVAAAWRFEPSRFFAPSSRSLRDPAG